MDLSEIVSLISIRKYMVDSVNNSSNIDRATVNYLNNAQLLIDKKIISLLQTDEFKEYVNFKDIKKEIEAVLKLNDIKSGIRDKL